MKAVLSPCLAPGCLLIQVAMVMTRSRTGIFSLKEEKRREKQRWRQQEKNKKKKRQRCLAKEVSVYYVDEGLCHRKTLSLHFFI